MTSSPSLIALVPAAGGGQRFGGPRPKQYAALHGKTVLECTLWRLHHGLSPDRLVVVLAPDDTFFATLSHLPPGVEAFRCGGVTRAESVRNGLLALAGQCRDDAWIAVHDAARPCVPSACLAALAALARTSGGEEDGALLALPLTDTLKESGVDEKGTVRAIMTHDRTRFWSAQTPQMFRYHLLCEALSQGGALSCTDEAQVVEQYCASVGGMSPKLFRGSVQNLKLTYAEDLALAEAILNFQENHST